MLIIGNGKPDVPAPETGFSDRLATARPGQVEGRAVFAANAPLNAYRRIATLFVLLTGGILFLACYMVFTSAKVVVMSAPQPVEAEFLADVARAPVDDEIGGGVFEVSDTLSRSFPASSLVAMEVPTEGRVRIVSRLSRSQTLIATTRLSTSEGIIFRTKKTVIIPAGGSVVADVASTIVGKPAEVGDATFTIPGLNEDTRRLFEVKAVAAIIGGTRDIRAVTAEDIDQAGAVLVKELSDALMARLRAAAAQAGIPSNGELMTVIVDSRTSDVPAGQEADGFTMKVTVKATGVFYDKAAFDQLLKKRLVERLAPGRAISPADVADATVILEKADLAAARANIRVRTRGTSVLSPEHPSLDPTKIAGITAEAAKRYLEKLDGVSSASVTVSPFWSNRLPEVAKRIKIEVR